jgi:hypothetical protein
VAEVLRSGIPLLKAPGQVSSSASFPPILITKIKVQNAESKSRTSGIAVTTAQDSWSNSSESECVIGGKMSNTYSPEAGKQIIPENTREDDYSENIIYLDHSNEPFPQNGIHESSAENNVTTEKENAVDEKGNDLVDEQEEHKKYQSLIAEKNTLTALILNAPRNQNRSQSIPQNVPQNVPQNIPQNIPRNVSTTCQGTLPDPFSGPMSHVGPSEQFFLLGRRNVLAYTLSSGYLLRNQGVSLELGGQQNKKDLQNQYQNQYQNNNSDITIIESGKTRTQKQLKKSSNATVYYNSLQKNGNKGKDRFSGGKLMFSTFFLEPAGIENKMQKNVNGRLPNFLCDFLVPLISAGFIDVKGHVAFDVGCVGVFVDVCLSLHVMVSERFLSFSEETSVTNGNNGNNASGSSCSSSSSSSSSSGDSGGSADSQHALQSKAGEDSRRELVAHANDLLLW